MEEETTPVPETPEVKEETPQPVEEEPVREEKKPRGLKTLSFFFLGIALILGFVFVGYILGQKGFRIEILKKEPTPTPTPELVAPPETTPTPTPDPTADWETYTNSQYAYQFKHPQGWIFTPSVIGDETQPLYVIRESAESNNINDYKITVKVWSNPDRRSLLDWIQFMRDSNAFALPAEDVEVVANHTVGGEPAFRIWSDPVSKGQEPGGCFQACPILTVHFTHGDKAFAVEHIYMREVDDASQELFRLLLSTFQFLD